MSKTETLAHRLLNAQKAINNAINTEPLKLRFERYNYTEPRLSYGLELVKKVQDLDIVKDKEYVGQYKATAEFDDIQTDCRKSYGRFRKLARIAFREDAHVLGAMGLLAKPKPTLAGFLKQARSLYRNACEDEEIMAKLADFGVKKEELAAELPKLEKLERIKEKQDVARGEAQVATKERDGLVEEMDRWLLDFYDIGRIACEDQPQYLEMMGIVVPS